MQLQGQIPNANADAVYEGWLRAFLKTSGDGDKTPYFVQTLENRERAFFWQQAYLITAVIDAYERNPTAGRRQLIADLLNRLLAQDLLDWTWDTWNDDVQWAIIACIRGYQATGITAFRDAAVNNWNLVYARGRDNVFGGGIWEDQDQIPDGGKLGLSNWPQIIPGCIIYEVLLPSDPAMANDILDKCKEIYEWARVRIWDPNTGRVYEGYYPDQSRNFSGDDNSYNYGLLVNSAASLFKVIGDPMYYNDAIKVADRNIAKINANTDGIMTEDKFYNGGFGCEQFVRGLAKLSRENFHWDKYWPFLKNNCDVAWSNRRPDFNFTQNDFSTPTPTSGYDFMAMELTGGVTIQQVTPVVQSIPATIEAEYYNYKSGVNVETLVDGGEGVNFVEAGDFVEYIIDIPSDGVYTITLSYSGVNQGSVQFLQNDRLLDIIELPSTGSMQTYDTVSSSVKLKAGIHSLRLKAITAGWNINSWQAQNCQEIVSAVSVNGSAAQAVTSLIINEGDMVAFNPTPENGTWGWTGPNGFEENSRQISINNIQLNQCGKYTAKYINEDGCASVQDYMLTMRNCTPTEIVSSIDVNGNTWDRMDSVFLEVGGYFTITPLQTDGAWSWTGPNGFTSTTENVEFYAVTSKEAGKYSATYYNANGCRSTIDVVVCVTGSDFCGSPITPFFTVNAGTWQNNNYVTLNNGENITMGPHPTDGGTWNWIGPNGFSASSREVTINNFSDSNEGYYTATHVNDAGCLSTLDFIIGSNNCTPTSIIPEIEVNGESWLESDSVALISGSDLTITLPVSADDGLLEWTLPGGIRFDDQSISFNNIQNWAEGNYEVTFDNWNGCRSSYSINITVDGDDNCGTAITPFLRLNEEAWQQINAATLNVGDDIQFGPHPLYINPKKWMWSGPNEFNDATRELTISNISSDQAGVYETMWINEAGCMSFMDFTVAVIEDVGIGDVAETQNSGIVIYPNPASSFVTLKKVAKNTPVIVSNLAGKVVLQAKSAQSNECILNVSNLEAGIYFIKVETEGKSIKMVKQ